MPVTGEGSGTVKFTAPAEECLLDIKYMLKSGETHVARTGTQGVLHVRWISVTGSLRVRPNRCVAGQEVKVEYTMSYPKCDDEDRIRIYHSGEKDLSKYVAEASGDGSKRGVVNFVAPAEEGKYVVKYVVPSSNRAIAGNYFLHVRAKPDMSNVDPELLEKARNAFREDIDLEIDFASVDDCASLSDNEKDRAAQWMKEGSLRSIFYDYSMPYVHNDAELSTMFYEKTKAVVLKYSDDTVGARDVRLEWNEKTLCITFGQGALGYSAVQVADHIRSAFAVELERKNFEENIIPKAEAEIFKALGPTAAIDIRVDWDSFSKAENPKESLSYLYSWDGYYTTKEIIAAVQYLAWYEDDRVVDAVADGVKSITFELAPGKETSSLAYEVDEEGNIILKYVFELQNSSGIFDSRELASIIKIAGLKQRPDLRIYLLESIATSWNLRCWGDIASLQKALDEPSLYWQSNDEEKWRKLKEDITSKLEGANDHVIKVWGNLQKINRKGKKQERVFVLTKEAFYTGELKGAGVKKDNFKKHELAEIIAVDVYAQKKEKKIGLLPRPTKLAFTIWVNEEKEKKSSGFGIKLPGVSLPDAPKVDLPSVPSLPDAPDLPSLPDMPDLPSLPSLPDMPDMPKISLPDLPGFGLPNFKLPKGLGFRWFKREKKEPPHRQHPVNHGKYTSTWIAHDMDGDEGNALIEEIAWALYGAWAAAKRSREEVPFYMTECIEGFTTATDIPDLRHKLGALPDED